MDLYSTKVSEENQVAIWGPPGGRIGWLKVIHLNMTF